MDAETAPNGIDKKAFNARYGPVALVTGASSGIGCQFAVRLAEIGLDLVLVARRIDRLEQLADRLREQNRVTVTVVQADLAQPQSIDSIASATSSLDIGLLVSNAGFGLKGEHSRNDPGKLLEMLHVNCNAPMQLCHRFIPPLLERKRGGIIITSSVEALMGFPFSAAYSATKGFTNNLGEALWGELSPLGIDVLALCPGSTNTEAHAIQGIDQSKLDGMMDPLEVVNLALENIANGPVYIAGEENQQNFGALTGLPRRDALLLVAENMKNAMKG